MRLQREILSIPLKNILDFAQVRVFPVLTLSVIDFSILHWFPRQSSNFFIESLLCILSFTGLRYIYKCIPVDIQVLVPG